MNRQLVVVIAWALWVLGGDRPTILSTHTTYEDCMKDVNFWQEVVQNQTPPSPYSIRTPEHSPVFGCRWVE